MKGFLTVDHGHSIYYEVLGPKNGKPFVYFHGGPGGSFSKRHQGFFNLKKHRVIFFDQRACGKSTFSNPLEANMTPHLIRDTVCLMDMLGFKKATMVGSSWGSTMALLMGIIHPKRTNGIIVCSVFLASKDAIDQLFNQIARLVTPESFDAFIANVPINQRGNPIQFYYKKIKCELLKPHTVPIYAREFNLLEGAVMSPTTSREELLTQYDDEPQLELLRSSAIECHYMAHHYFLPNDFILKNASKLSRFNVQILHGRNDLVCPVLQAYQLHKKIRGSTLTILNAGHGTRAPDFTKALKRAIRL